MKKILTSLLAIFVLPAFNICVYAISADERVDTAIRYATVIEEVGIRLAPQFSGKPALVLEKGQEVEILYRSRDKDVYNGKKDYWYEIQFEHPTGGYSCYWVFGGFLQKKITYTPPWNIFYGASKESVDTDEMENVFPQYAYPLKQRLRFYKTDDLQDPKFLSFRNDNSRRIKIIGRLPKGYSLPDYMNGEVFEIVGVENAGVRSAVVESGYVKAEDLVRVDKTHLSPQGHFKIAEGVMGCKCFLAGTSCKDITFKWLDMGRANYIFLGVAQLPGFNEFAYSPADEYLFTNLYNFQNNTKSAVYDRSGKLVVSSKDYLVSPTWVDSNIIFLRGGSEQDRVYKVNLASHSIVDILSLEGEYQQPNIVEMVPTWPPVVYDPQNKTITAVFSRPPGGYDDVNGRSYYTEVSITTDLSGTVLKKETKTKYDGAP